MAQGYMPQPVPARVARAMRLRGARPVIGDLARWGSRLVAGMPRAIARQPRGEFSFEGERYRYLFHPHKWTWLTERAVEVPVVQAAVDQHAGRRVLEVGNVLSHYRRQSHLVVDKYERAPGVLNRDVLELDDLGRFDLIVAISTIEHVGWDEEPRDPAKAQEALRRLEAMLAPGGRLVVTLPVGYNASLDAAIRDGSLRVPHLGALRREAGGTRWRQAPPQEVWPAPYDFVIYRARAVLIAVFDRPAG
jgi:SAM-dependent methyltransferase